MKESDKNGSGRDIEYVSEIITESITSPPAHHFFGFHDICAWNSEGDKIAALRVNIINRPPNGTDIAEAGYIDEGTGKFWPLIETTAYNFPQGARQLWSPKGGLWVNIRLDDKWGAVRVSEDGARMQTICQALYAISNDGNAGWGLNFARLNRLMGYGYVGLPDHTVEEAAPISDGIWAVDLYSGENKLLVSTRDVAESAGGIIGQGHHYLTHLVPSPNNSRLLFLHRYWLNDGGLHHRLMSVQSDGNDLRCHAEGFLSHFDWLDEGNVIIWGRSGNQVDRLRRHPFLQLPGVRPIAKLAKTLVKRMTGNNKGMQMHFLKMDLSTDTITPFWPEILKADGHPMVCPSNREWMIVDTYPAADGNRELMLLNVSNGRQYKIGKFMQAQIDVDISSMEKTLEHVDQGLVDNLGIENIAFWRSGVHCDLHPRWKADGTAACIDSVHERTRQMYKVITQSALKN